MAQLHPRFGEPGSPPERANRCFKNGLEAAFGLQANCSGEVIRRVWNLITSSSRRRYRNVRNRATMSLSELANFFFAFSAELIMFEDQEMYAALRYNCDSTNSSGADGLPLVTNLHDLVVTVRHENTPFSREVDKEQGVIAVGLPISVTDQAVSAVVVLYCTKRLKCRVERLLMRAADWPNLENLIDFIVISSTAGKQFTLPCRESDSQSLQDFLNAVLRRVSSSLDQFSNRYSYQCILWGVSGDGTALSVIATTGFDTEYSHDYLLFTFDTYHGTLSRRPPGQVCDIPNVAECQAFRRKDKVLPMRVRSVRSVLIGDNSKGRTEFILSIYAIARSQPLGDGRNAEAPLFPTAETCLELGSFIWNLLQQYEASSIQMITRKLRDAVSACRLHNSEEPAQLLTALFGSDAAYLSFLPDVRMQQLRSLSWGLGSQSRPSLESVLRRDALNLAGLLRPTPSVRVVIKCDNGLCPSSQRQGHHVLSCAVLDSCGIVVVVQLVRTPKRSPFTPTEQRLLRACASSLPRMYTCAAALIAPETSKESLTPLSNELPHAGLPTTRENMH